MRVVAGSARSLKLKTPAGMDVRPTTDRIKETLFNIINNDVHGSDFLDMFCGSGGIGIEALSRGAESAVFVDSSKISLDCTRENLEHTKLISAAQLMKADCISAVSRLYHEGRRFDIIFMDPPYNHELEKSVLAELANYNILKDDGFIIVEASAETGFDYLDAYGFTMSREKSYGSNKHIFIRRKDK